MRIHNRVLARLGYYRRMFVREIAEFLSVWKLYWKVCELAEVAEGTVRFLRLRCPDTDSDIVFTRETVGPKVRELKSLHVFLGRPISFSPSYASELRRLHRVWSNELDEVIPSFLRKRDEIALGILGGKSDAAAMERFLALRSDRLRTYLEETVLSPGLKKRIADALASTAKKRLTRSLSEVNECLLSAMIEIELAEFHERNLATMSNEALNAMLALETLLKDPETSVEGKSKLSLHEAVIRQREQLQQFDPIDDSVSDFFYRCMEAVGAVVSYLT